MAAAIVERCVEREPHAASHVFLLTNTSQKGARSRWLRQQQLPIIVNERSKNGGEQIRQPMTAARLSISNLPLHMEERPSRAGIAFVQCTIDNSFQGSSPSTSMRREP
jgi:hypothetical protein